MEQNPDLLDDLVWCLIRCFLIIGIHRSCVVLCGLCVLYEMQRPQHNSRINLAEMKAQIVRKLGPDPSKQYFHFLDKFLSMKMSKVEFNKLCSRIFGRENIPLHNNFIRSILKNACTAKHPPASQVHDIIKSDNAVGSTEASTDGYIQNGSHIAAVQASNPQGLSNGDILSLSPRKARSVHHDRRSRDHRSALGANGITNFVSQHVSGKESNFILENGICIPHDVQGSMQQDQGGMLPTECEREASAQTPLKIPQVMRSSGDPMSKPCEGQIQVSTVRDQKDMHARTQLQAPLGLPFCSASVGGAHRAVTTASSSKCISSLNSGVLLDSATLKERMEQIAAFQGLESVSMDCANLLNNGLNTYLKGLISSYTDLVAARSGYEPVKNKQQTTFTKLANGVRPGQLYQVQSGGNKPLDPMPAHRSPSPITLQDFRDAMELNPQQLGEDWPVLLERICTRAYEE